VEEGLALIPLAADEAGKVSLHERCDAGGDGYHLNAGNRMNSEETIADIELAHAAG
jgi:hypothetical protein